MKSGGAAPRRTGGGPRMGMVLPAPCCQEAPPHGAMASVAVEQRKVQARFQEAHVQPPQPSSEAGNSPDVSPRSSSAGARPPDVTQSQGEGSWQVAGLVAEKSMSGEKSGRSIPVSKNASGASNWSSKVEQQVRQTLADFGLLRSSTRELDFMSLAESEACLLRATSLTTILRGGARIFASSLGDEETYALSRNVQEIDIFLSHNWSVGRRAKHLALSYQFNLRMAQATSLAVMLLCCFLTMLGTLPTVRVAWAPLPRGIACKVLGTPVFLTILLLGGDLRKLLGLSGPSVFLDKTCISQSDKELQKQGIMKLGAFLSHSRRMLVIYHDVYLRKLWTVYEFACFLCSHPIQEIRLVPTSVPAAVIGACIVMSIGLIVTTVAEAFIGFEWALESCMMAFGPFLTIVLRQEAREHSNMKERFKDFSLEKCTCAHEEDRPLVYSNISNLMRQLGVVPGSSSEETALNAFNELARKKLPALLVQAERGERYRFYVVLSAPICLPYYLDKQVGVIYGLPLRECILDFFLSVNQLLFTLPVSCAMMAELSRHCQGLGTVAEVCYILLVTILAGLYPIVVFFAQVRLGKAPSEDVASLVLFLLLFLVSGTVTTAIFCGFPGCLSRRVPSTYARTGSGKLVDAHSPGKF